MTCHPYTEFNLYAVYVFGNCRLVGLPVLVLRLHLKSIDLYLFRHISLQLP